MHRTIIPYDAKLKPLAKELRNDSTLGEILLWKELKGKKFFGYDFHRQKPLLRYIVDFYCSELNLVIEIDGRYHCTAEMQEADQERDTELGKYNLTVLRFSEDEVKKDIVNVLRTIEVQISHCDAE